MKSCTRPSCPGYARNSLLGQGEQCQPPVSSSLFSGGFHLTGDNTNSHLKVAEENGSAGKQSSSKPGKELNMAVENTVHGGDGNSTHVVLSGLWKLGHHGFWSTCSVPSHVGLLQLETQVPLSAVLTRMLCTTSASVLPTPIIFMDYFPSWGKNYHFLNASQMFFKPKTCNHKFLKAGKWWSLKKTTTFFKAVTDSQNQDNTEARTPMGILQEWKRKIKVFSSVASHILMYHST